MPTEINLQDSLRDNSTIALNIYNHYVSKKYPYSNYNWDYLYKFTLELDKLNKVLIDNRILLKLDISGVSSLLFDYIGFDHLSYVDIEEYMKWIKSLNDTVDYCKVFLETGYVL